MSKPWLSAAALSPVPTTTLPCGRYEAENGIPSDLQFGDAGVVQLSGYATRLRAREADAARRRLQGDHRAAAGRRPAATAARAAGPVRSGRALGGCCIPDGRGHDYRAVFLLQSL